MKNNLLISIDFRGDKGGIARVARLMSRSVDFQNILSLHGNNGEDLKAQYYNENRFLFSLKVLTLILFQRPVLIVFDHLNVARILALIPRFLLGKVIIYLHDEEAWIKVTGVRKTALIKATTILCNSNYTLKKFIFNNPEFVAKTKACLPAGVPVHFSIQENSFSEKYSTWFNDPRPYCIFVSRLWKVHRFKGYLELLEAFKQYYKISDNPNLRLAIIGRGDDAPVVQEFIQQNNLDGSVALFEDVDDGELKSFYEKSLCLIFPSTREGFGMVFLEAMYLKKACIAIAGQPAEEIIIPEKTGILLPDNSPDTINKLLFDIEKNPEKYKLFGECGFERYCSHFTINHFKERFLSLLDDGI